MAAQRRSPSSLFPLVHSVVVALATPTLHIPLGPSKAARQTCMCAPLRHLPYHPLRCSYTTPAAAGRASQGPNPTAGPGAIPTAALANVSSLPLLPLAPSLKPFPWPAFTLDLGATAAALFFNLLLVSAFISPTRSAVAAVVQVGGGCRGGRAQMRVVPLLLRRRLLPLPGQGGGSAHRERGTVQLVDKLLRRRPRVHS